MKYIQASPNISRVQELPASGWKTATRPTTRVPLPTVEEARKLIHDYQKTPSSVLMKPELRKKLILACAVEIVPDARDALVSKAKDNPGIKQLIGLGGNKLIKESNEDLAGKIKDVLKAVGLEDKEISLPPPSIGNRP